MKPRLSRDITTALERAGLNPRAFSVLPSARGHAIIRDASGGIVAVVPGTPSDARWQRNLAGDLRRIARTTKPLAFVVRYRTAGPRALMLD